MKYKETFPNQISDPQSEIRTSLEKISTMLGNVIFCVCNHSENKEKLARVIFCVKALRSEFKTLENVYLEMVTFAEVTFERYILNKRSFQWGVFTDYGTDI